MFRFKKAVPVSYDLQGYIYFYSRLYRMLPVEEKKRIVKICEAAGGEHAQALLEFVTTDAGATSVCRHHYLSQSTLERVVRKYYTAFAEDMQA